MKTRKLFTLLLALCMVITLLPVSASAATVVDSGVCGGTEHIKNLKWTLYSNGKLTISGSGDIDDYATAGAYGYSPWFKHRESITEVKIDNGVKSIGNAAFFGCTNLTTVTIPSSVGEIGDFAFGRCRSLTDIPSLGGTQILGKNAFYGCTGFTEVTVPSAITTVYPGLFTECTNLTHVTFEGNIVDIGDGAFSSCSSLEDISFNGEVSGKIGSHAFDDCTSLVDYEIPKGITSIDSNAFEGCSNLTSVTIPDTVERIWSSAFRESGLVNITIPESVGFIDVNIFVYCEDLEHITMYASSIAGVKKRLIASNALTSVHIIGDEPEEVPEIFSLWTQDVVVYYDEDASGWEGSTWSGYAIEPWDNGTGTKSGICGDNLTWSLENRVLTISGTGDMFDYEKRTTPWFIYRNRIDSLVIEQGVSSIGAYAFYSLHNVTDISMPSSVKSIGDCAFSCATKLTEVVIPYGVTTLGHSVFQDCPALTSVVLADSVLTIGTRTFHMCNNLTNVTLSSNLSAIPFDTFFFCDALTQITIPASVSSLDSDSFYNCTSLASIIFLGDAPTIDADAFSHVKATAYYPLDNRTWTKDITKNYGGSITWTTDSHDHEYETVVIAPTCTEQGYTTYSCARCVESYVGNYTGPISHTPGEVHVENEIAATCSANGSYDEVTYCTVCGVEVQRVTVETDALPHTYEAAQVEATCTEPGGILHTCTVCGDSYLDAQSEPLGHTYADGFCTVCGNPERALGDVNGDGEIDILDANLVVAWYNEIRELDEESLAAADVNGDGEVDIMDANMIVAYYNELIDAFPKK